MSKPFVFFGTATALVTPFTADGAVDFEALDRLLDYQLEGGIDGLVPTGSTGESATLSVKEKLRIFEHVLQKVNGRVPVIAGTGSNNTQATIELTKEAARLGVNAALIVCPYYNKPTQEGIIAHYTAIAEAVDLPIILYNVPGRTAVNMTAETQLRLAEECENIIGTKEASGNLEQMMEIIRSAPSGFVVLSGDDALTLPLIAVGGKGVISVISNYAPKAFSDMVRFALEDDFHRARTIHCHLLPLMRLNFIESNPIPVKAALAMMGLIQEQYRLPLTPMKPENRQKLRQALIAAGYLPADTPQSPSPPLPSGCGTD